MSVWERVYKINSVNSEGERERKAARREREGERERERKDYQHLQQHSSPEGIEWTFEPWWQAVAAMHGACSCLLVMWGCVCLSRKACRLQQRVERKGEWGGARGGSLTCSSLPRKRAAAMQMSWNPYADEQGEKLISGQILWRVDTVDGYQRVQRNSVSDGRSETGRPIVHSTVERVQTGHGSDRREVKGREFRERGAMAPTNLRGGHLCTLQTASRCIRANTRKKTGINVTELFL